MPDADFIYNLISFISGIMVGAILGYINNELIRVREESHKVKEDAEFACSKIAGEVHTLIVRIENGGLKDG